MVENICQSCGMPMVAIEHFGTKSNSSLNNDYCCFCFKEGKFTDNFTFEEFINDSIKDYKETEKLNGYYLSKDELALKARVKLLPLKRWSSHQTHEEYYKSVNRAVDYINKHLTDAINLSDLANVANISEFHFHRIFKAIMNESPGDFIQRLRLEKACFKLQTSKHTLTEIAEQIGYQSVQALSKAFKKRFGITPALFRNQPGDLTIPLNQPVENLPLDPEIKSIKPKEVIYIQVANPYKAKDAFIKAWNKLNRYTNATGIPNDEQEYLCMTRDLSTITNPERIRVYACIRTSAAAKPSGKFGVQTIEGGMYAIFRHKGSYSKLEQLYCSIYRYWIPNSSYQLRDSLHFEKYLNSPNQVNDDDLLTEIHVPVTPM
jgi:AraC family transcriptional regulator